MFGEPPLEHTMGNPTSSENHRDTALRLALLNGIGPRLRQSLLERFGTAERVFEAPFGELRQVPGIGSKLAAAIRQATRDDRPQQVMRECRQHGLTVLLEEDDAYPALLQEIHDPPGVLFVRGTLLPTDGLAVAIVGTRRASPYGRRQAERLARGLAVAGVTIVSGLARGIDAAAHRGAIAAGGRTIAVLAGGLLNVYPPEHEDLARQVADHGVVLSETVPSSPPRSSSFPQRNRLISGLSLAVVVVEAGSRSGALITAEHAMEQGRDVFAVPGRVDSPQARGCHRLIRDGAGLVECPQDILEQLGPLSTAIATEQGSTIRSGAELQLNDQERHVLDAIGPQPTPVDDVVVASGLSVHRVLATLSALEMRRLIRRAEGSCVVRL